MEQETLKNENYRLQNEGVMVYLFDEYIDGFVTIVIREKELNDTIIAKIIEMGYKPLGKYPKKRNSYSFMIAESELIKIHSGKK